MIKTTLLILLFKISILSAQTINVTSNQTWNSAPTNPVAKVVIHPGATLTINAGMTFSDDIIVNGSLVTGAVNLVFQVGKGIRINGTSTNRAFLSSSGTKFTTTATNNVWGGIYGNDFSKIKLEFSGTVYTHIEKSEGVYTTDEIETNGAKVSSSWRGFTGNLNVSQNKRSFIDLKNTIIEYNGEGIGLYNSNISMNGCIVQYSHYSGLWMINSNANAYSWNYNAFISNGISAPLDRAHIEVYSGGIFNRTNINAPGRLTLASKTHSSGIDFISYWGLTSLGESYPGSVVNGTYIWGYLSGHQNDFWGGLPSYGSGYVLFKTGPNNPNYTVHIRNSYINYNPDISIHHPSSEGNLIQLTDISTTPVAGYYVFVGNSKLRVTDTVDFEIEKQNMDWNAHFASLVKETDIEGIATMMRNRIGAISEDNKRSVSTRISDILKTERLNQLSSSLAYSALSIATQLDDKSLYEKLVNAIESRTQDMEDFKDVYIVAKVSMLTSVNKFGIANDLQPKFKQMTEKSGFSPQSASYIQGLYMNLKYSDLERDANQYYGVSKEEILSGILNRKPIEKKSSYERETTNTRNVEISSVYPNPFNPVAKFTLNVREKGHVNLSIYDMIGKKIATLNDKELSKGIHEVSFDGSKFSTGVYVWKVSHGSSFQTGKMTLLK